MLPARIADNRRDLGVGSIRTSSAASRGRGMRRALASADRSLAHEGATM
jgi:hypothetical protein